MMKRIVLLTLLITASCVIALQAVFAQTGVSLEVEIKNIENSAARQGISAADKHDALVRLARLRQLSGDIEGAAKNWLEAANAVSGQTDDNALLSCAYCLAAMGEWDSAATALEPLLSKLPRARFLDSCIKAVKTGDLSALAAIADNPAYSQMKAEILFVLWKLSQGERKSGEQGSSQGGAQGTAQSDAAEKWRQRLVDEFPQALEGMLAAGNISSVIVMPSPFWLFAGGLDSLPVLASERLQETATVHLTAGGQPNVSPVQTVPAPQVSVSQASTPQTSVSQTYVPQTQVSQVSAPQTSSSQTPAIQSSASQASSQTSASQPSPQSNISTNVRLQTGIYSREANAQAQFTNLIKAGFTPSIELRTVNGNEMWAVIVPAGSDTNKTIASLRAAGFDSFPLR
jgi:tetratricopeptide (TPR) repeat protein